MKTSRKAPAARKIRQNVWGNWYGYVSGRRARAFGNTPEETAEQQAARWLAGDDTAGIPSGRILKGQ